MIKFDIEVNYSGFGYPRDSHPFDSKLIASELQKAQQLHLDGKNQLFKEEMISLLDANPNFLASIVATCAGSDNKYRDIKLWVLDNKFGFEDAQEFKDKGLLVGVFYWDPVVIQTFVDLGANAQQEPISGRSLHDICFFRTTKSYNGGLYPHIPADEELQYSLSSIERGGGEPSLYRRYKAKIHGLDKIKNLGLVDAWWGTLFQSMVSLADNNQSAVCDLIVHCFNKSKKPSNAWLKKAEAILDDIGRDQFAALAVGALSAASELRDNLVYGTTGALPYYFDSDTMKESHNVASITESSSFILKSLAWLLMKVDEERYLNDVSSLCEAMFLSYFNLGIRDVKLATALFALLLTTENGRTVAEGMLEKAECAPALKKMNALLNKS